jgi:hypothetical protein
LRETPNAIAGPADAVRLLDGRSLTFSAAGPEDGFRVVYCHGAIGSPSWRTPELDAVIERLSIGSGLRSDVGELMSALRYDRFSAIS